jgi:soluble lytic murein transglycosylase-like protein
MRTDPSHENIVARMSPVAPVTDAGVTRTWKAMETAATTAQAERESVITRQMEENKAFGLTRQLAEDIYDMAAKANVEPDVAFGLVRAESSFKDQATSYVGAVGLTQLMPATAKWLEPGTTREDLRNSETNLRIGFGYLRQLIDKYDGNEDLALVAYNRGPGTVDRILKKGGNPDNGYAKFVRTGNVGDHKL